MQTQLTLSQIEMHLCGLIWSILIFKQTMPNEATLNTILTLLLEK